MVGPLWQEAAGVRGELAGPLGAPGHYGHGLDPLGVMRGWGGGPWALAGPGESAHQPCQRNRGGY